jgi:hypothetical protein
MLKGLRLRMRGVKDTALGVGGQWLADDSPRFTAE